ncbi:unnamed protein product [Clonostachys solani]|uniref:Major facilitator superfamily (MFS) profile domain-containing protein n=1 Tax=Clonostachys solani TaxID=160281 RepID=A0A9N9ZHN2_9HYPO|nr:unnamed protein product [Clonostachys solani]
MVKRHSQGKRDEVSPTLAAVLHSNELPWYKKAHLRNLNLLLFSIMLYASANGYDGSMMNGLQALTPWQEFMNHPTGPWLGFINSVTNLGSLTVLFPAAWTVQKFGRKSGIYIANLSLIIGVVLQTAAHNPTTFIMGRFFIGVTNQWLSISTGLLITETAYPSHRGILTALYSCGWYPGALLAAWTTYGTRNYTSSWGWRIPSVLQLLIPAIALPGFLLSPESPRYYVSIGKVDKAKEVLSKYHTGGKDDELLAIELEEIVATLALEKQVKESVGWRDLFSTRGTKHRFYITVTLGIFHNWCGNGVVAFYLTTVLNKAGITSVTNQTLINGFLQIWNLIWAVGAAFSVDLLGRRKLFLLSTVIMLVSYIFVTAFSGSFAETGSKSIGIAVVPFLFIFYAGYDIAFTPLFMAYAAEIWPYNLRARGLSLLYLIGQTSTFLNVFANPIALDAIAWKYYIIYIVILILGLLNIYLYYPETKAYTLEEIAVIFDGKDAATPTRNQILERSGQSKSASAVAAGADEE